MSSIWQNDGEGWRLAAPHGFGLEAELHDLVEDSPQLLPLAGSPHITVLGREVRLGNGIADLVAVESSGRPVIVEVKLRSNAEARRAVVTQILTYAAYMHGLEASDLEGTLLTRHLQQRGYSSILDAVSSDDQLGAIDPPSFSAALQQNLTAGSFRLVIVLDESPPELVELVGYLEVVAERLVIDLVTVSQYQIGSSTILVPQRIEPERQVAATPTPRSRPSGQEPYLAAGTDDFKDRIVSAPSDNQATLQRMVEWADALDHEALVYNSTYHGKSDRRLTLLPRLRPAAFGPGGIGLVTLWNDNGSPYVQFWRSVFERRAPNSLVRVNELIAPLEVSQGNTTNSVTNELLDALTDAYREAMAAEPKSS